MLNPAGNILSKTINGVTTTFTYDAANQLAASVKDGQTTEYRYDAAGRLVTEGDKNYNYGYLDKILKVVDNGQTTATFDYHVNGQIASVNRNNQSENFLWDGLALIHRGETSLVNEPAITGGNPILANGKPILEDLLGTSLGALKDGNFEANELTSFGEPVNPSTDNYFTGKPYIGELGYAFLFRNYRPEKGKWQTQDPIGYPDGWNNFAYVNNEVTVNIDIWGTETVDLGRRTKKTFEQDEWSEWTEVPGYPDLVERKRENYYILQEEDGIAVYSGTAYSDWQKARNEYFKLREIYLNEIAKDPEYKGKKPEMPLEPEPDRITWTAVGGSMKEHISWDRETKKKE